MKALVFALMFASLVLQAQSPLPTSDPGLAVIFNFETEQTGKMPRGWGGGPPETISVDADIVHGGRWSVRLERSTGGGDGFSTITKGVPMDFRGTTLEWRGFLRTEDVSSYTGLWMREDGDAGGLAFDNMQQRQINGTRGWTEYSITLPIRPDAKTLYFGVLLGGTGKVWADDLQLLVDGKPIWNAPKVERPKTAIDLDHEFDAGSGVVLSDLSKVQIENLATMGKVWGFLKYHHPAVTAGKRHWDYELFRAMPKVLAARDRETSSAALRDWIRGLGDVPHCSP